MASHRQGHTAHNIFLSMNAGCDWCVLANGGYSTSHINDIMDKYKCYHHQTLASYVPDTPSPMVTLVTDIKMMKVCGTTATVCDGSCSGVLHLSACETLTPVSTVRDSPPRPAVPGQYWSVRPWSHHPVR